MKKTIFTGNKKTEEVLIEGIIFAFGTCVFLTIIATFVIITLNFIR